MIAMMKAIIVCLMLTSTLSFQYVSKTRWTRITSRVLMSDSSESPNTEVSAEPTKKGFGTVKKKVTEIVEKDAGTKTYEAQAKRGVPEYNIFMRPTNSTDTEWVPVGSMTIPRDTTPSKAIYDVEKELLAGTFKLYPKLKSFYEVRKDKEGLFEYGYILKAFPDELITVAKPPTVNNNSNFFMTWLGKLTDPVDSSDLKNKGEITLKQ